jgi:hypothetical protein
MRWQDLFADLESQAEALERAERDAEVADRSRAEQAMVELTARLAAACGMPLALRVSGVGEISGELETVGQDWLLIGQEDGHEVLVLTSAVSAVRDLHRRAQADVGRNAVLARLGVVSPLRAVARDRATVRVALRDGSQITGTPERVGADHLDLVVHEVGEPARSAGRERVTVPFDAIAVVRTAASGWG